MAADRVQIMRAVFDRWATGDLSAGADLFDDAIVYIVGPGFPNEGIWHGPAGVRDMLSEFLESWRDYRIDATEMIPAGDTVVAAVHQKAEGKGSGVPTELSYFQVWTFQGSKVVRIESCMTRAEALEAAGLSE